MTTSRTPSRRRQPINQIPNVFFAEVLPAIKSLAEFKVTMVVMRQTLGYHRKSDLISITNDTADRHEPVGSV